MSEAAPATPVKYDLDDLKARYDHWSNQHYLDRDDSICHDLMAAVEDQSAEIAKLKYIVDSYS